MKANRSFKNIKSMRELSLYRQMLEDKEKMLEQKVADISEDIVDNFTDKLKDLAFNLSSRLIAQFFTKKN